MNILLETTNPKELVKTIGHLYNSNLHTVAESLRDARNYGAITTEEFYLAVYQLAEFIDGHAVITLPTTGRLSKQLGALSVEVRDAFESTPVKFDQMVAKAYEAVHMEPCPMFEKEEELAA